MKSHQGLIIKLRSLLGNVPLLEEPLPTGDDWPREVADEPPPTPPSSESSFEEDPTTPKWSGRVQGSTPQGMEEE